MSRLITYGYKIVLVYFLLFTINIEAQVDNELIQKDFTTYLDAIVNKDFEASLDYLVDDVFEIIPRETMVAVMEQTFNTEGIEFTFGDFNINTINEPIKIDSTSYVILNYTSHMSIRFTSSEDEKETTEEDKKMNRIFTETALEQQFGKGNVNYNESTDFYDVIALKKAVAVKKESYIQWKFLVIDKSNPYLLKAILPNSILEKVLTED